METTVKVKIGKEMISSVVFGAVDFRVDEKIKCDITSKNICLFDAKSEALLTQGSVVVK